MLFGLENAGVTYWRMMTKVFKDQIGRNREMYVDGMLIKFKGLNDHFMDFKLNFTVMLKSKVKFNPH